MQDFIYRAKPWAITMFFHNWPVIVLAPLILWSAWRLYLRPSRQAVLLLYGFATLAFAFEYEKHGVPVFRGTVTYLFSEYANPGLREAGLWLLVSIAPGALYLLGLAFLVIALVTASRRSTWPSSRLPGRPRSSNGNGC